MTLRNDQRCPLCGAHLTAESLLDCREELIDETRGILGGRCPHCQGYLEAMPQPGRLDVGYSDKGGNFEVVLSLPCNGLAVARVAGSDVLTVQANGRQLRFTAVD